LKPTGDEPEGDPQTTSRTEYAVAVSIWLLGVVTAVASYGVPDDFDPVGLAFAGIWATLHFVLVCIAVLEQTVGPFAVALATFVAVVTLVFVPRAVDASIADDESSTAALIHIWDPVLMALPVGAVLAVGWLLRRRRSDS
jgi:uncharacterized protein (TIGR03382 family)